MSLPHPSSSSSAASTSKHTLEHEAPVVSRGRELTRPPSTHVVDPSIAWEAQRRAWLAKRPRRDQAGEGTAEQEQEGEEGITTTTTTRGRRPEQTEAMSRAIILEELLDEAIRLDKLARMREDERNQMLDDQKRPGLMGVGVGVSGGSASTLTESIGGRSGEMMARSGSGGGAGGEEFKVPPTRTIEEQPDDGQTISLDGTTLSRATGAILLAFRQGRMLRDPLPLRLVTKLLYRSWLSDGTIPRGYVSTASNSLTPPPPDLSPPSTVTTTVYAAPRTYMKKIDDVRPMSKGGGTPFANLKASSSWRREKDFDSSTSDVI